MSSIFYKRRLYSILFYSILYSCQLWPKVISYSRNCSCQTIWKVSWKRLCYEIIFCWPKIILCCWTILYCLLY